MADATKQASIHGGLISEIKTLFSLSKTQKTLQFAYGCMLGLVLFTVFLAFSPSSNSSTNLYSVPSFNASSIFSQQSYRSIFSYFFPNSSHINPNLSPPYSVSVKNDTHNSDLDNQIGKIKQNQSTIEVAKSPMKQNHSTIEIPKSPIKQNQSTIEIPKSPIKQKQSTFEVPKSPIKQNQSTIEVPKSPIKQNQSTIEIPKSPIKQNQSTIEIPKSPIKQNQSTVEIPKSPIASNFTEKITPNTSLVAENSTENKTKKEIIQKGVGIASDLTSSLLKKQSNGSNLVKQGSEDLINNLMNCDLFDGEWVIDNSYPLYKPGSCSLIDEQFNCFLNGRPDNGYYKLKWKPKGCSIPRLNGTHMLEMLRGKRLVFVGDSLNRNMWESLVCILRNSVKDQSKVYEASGRHHFRSEPSYSFVFKDYHCTVEFFVSPFLVQEWEVAEKSGSKKETLRLDLVGRSADQYKTADILIFNTGHWWTHEKTAKGQDYYQEGRHVYHDLNVLEAFHKALNTWGKWVDANVNPRKSLVFFRGYSASHFRGGQWNSGGQCDHETEPIKNDTYLSRYPPKMAVLEQVLNNMKTQVSYLNITRLTDYRKDGHPSMYRKQIYSKEELKSPLSFQDCSHWCLPGVPDAWNELLYAELLIKNSQKKQH